MEFKWEQPKGLFAQQFTKKHPGLLCITGYHEAFCDDNTIQCWYVGYTTGIVWIKVCAVLSDSVPFERTRNTRFTDWEKSLT